MTETRADGVRIDGGTDGGGTDGGGTDEGVLDPWVADWIEANPLFPIRDIYTFARGDITPFPVTRELANVYDDVVEGIPVRIYEVEGEPTGLLVYFHGGGYCIGSISIMDNVARELAHACQAVVVSVEYRLAPEHPFPAGLDDCETVTRWALANTARFGVAPDSVMVAGESAGGNFAASVSMRLRDGAAGLEAPLAGQVLIYPGVDDGTEPSQSRKDFGGRAMSVEDIEWCWAAYTGGRDDLHDDPYLAPLRAPSHADLPPAIVILGGCDFLRDEGRAYAGKLRDSGVEVEETCYPGQIHGFVNQMFPVAADAFERIGTWVQTRFAAT
jgi:acetyl esterase